MSDVPYYIQEMVDDARLVLPGLDWQPLPSGIEAKVMPGINISVVILEDDAGFYASCSPFGELVAVHGKNMTLEETLRVLSRQLNKVEEAIHHSREGVGVVNPLGQRGRFEKVVCDLLRILRDATDPGMGRKVDEFLSTLDEDDVWRIKVVMYAGREGETLAAVSRSTPCEGKSLDSLCISEKTLMLRRYLLTGFSAAREQKFDLEGLWTPRVRPMVF